MQDFRSESYKKRADDTANKGGYGGSSNRTKYTAQSGNTTITTDSPTALILTEEGLKPLNAVGRVTDSPTLRASTIERQTFTDAYVEEAKMPGVNSPGTNPFTNTVSAKVSGSVAAKLAREGQNPQSIRDDTSYLLSVKKGERQKYNLNTPAKGTTDDKQKKKLDQNLPNFNRNSSSSNSSVQKSSGYTGSFNLGSDNSGGNRVLPEQKESFFTSFFEKQVNFSEKWEKAINKRETRSKEYFTNVIRYSPFRNDGESLSFAEKVGAFGLSAPSRLVTGLESVGLAGYKGILLGQAFILNRKEATQEAKSAAFLTIPALKKTFNFRDPEGVVNIASAVAAPSFLGRSVQTVKAPLFLGKEKIAAESIVEPEVLSGAKTFPSSSKSAPELQVEFKQTPFQTAIKEKLGREVEGGFSASPNKLQTKGGVQAGTSETPGLYIAPSLSKYFLKINSGEKPSFSILPSFRTPSANFIETPVGLIPRALIRGVERDFGIKIGEGGQKNVALTGSQRSAAIEELNTYFEQGAEKGGIAGTGKSAITPEFYLGKGEKEAVVSTGSSLTQTQEGYNLWQKATGFKYYTSIDGQKVPLRILKAGESDAGIIGAIKTSANTRLLRNSYRNPSMKIPLSSFATSSSKPSSTAKPSRTASMKRSSVLDENIKALSFSTTPSRPSNITRSTNYTPARPSNSNRSYRESQPSYTIKPSSSYYPNGTTLTSITGWPGRGKVPPPTRQAPPFKRRSEEDLTFNVLVRRRGQFLSVNRTPIKFDQALRLGQSITKETAARSFKIVPASYGGASKISALLNTPMQQYYSKKGVFIEKSKFAINRQGEYREISLKGQRSARKATSIL